MSWLHFMWIPSIRPKEENAIKQWFDVCHLVTPAFRKYSQQATVLL
jgi:hypothetical protein